MSKVAYENYFRQPAPEGALFGVDVSWFQATADGNNLDYATARGYWEDFSQWADFVCIRVSYGSNGDDGAQALHFQLAKELNYKGQLGVYHFQHANYGWEANLNNFLDKSFPFVGRISFYMHDYESVPNAGAEYIKTTCTATENARGKPVTNYGGKYYWQATGGVPCPAEQFWIAQYPGRSEDAWSITGVPEMPAQYSGSFPGVWQWQSSTPEHGHLDLNISTTPQAFGLNESEDDFMSYLSQEQQFDMANRIEVMFNQQNARDFDALSLVRDIFNMVTWNEQRAPELMELVRLIPTLTDSITKSVVSALNANGGTTTTPVDYDKIATIVVAALKKLVLHAD